MTEPIYLDNNATTLPREEVLAAMQEAAYVGFANPGSRHAAGRAARRFLEDSREAIAEIIDCDSSELFFTSGGTESTNLALRGLAARGKPGEIIVPAGEHPATEETVKSLCQHGWKLRELKLHGTGLVDWSSLPTADAETSPNRIATLLHANNETGVIQDLAPFHDWQQESPIPLHLDAVQAVGKIPVSFRQLGATTLSFGAHKFHGPRGIGGLVVRSGVKLAPQFTGGFQERELRPGTEPVALAVGMAKALELAVADQKARMQQLAALRDHFEAELAKACGPIVINGADAPRLPNTANVAFPGIDGEALLITLDLERIACSLGSACQSGSVEPSPVLVAMGLPKEVYHSSVRFSLSSLTTKEEIDEAVLRIVRVVESLKII
ncbi:cysteine desulfurase family protein [Calycomorphotria hydatis]|uniref:Cysteine desulfurase n=1 Tax=Calycomorphotria hydatis TaxID=2528027 RepID=A0A517TFG8_9PLAN|nr:cysteine desulfurase family protein [Calycomorphotria hydatis]QDT67102.1 Cysteine desulfurase [Calycomorphotria hydatis]